MSTDFQVKSTYSFSVFPVAYLGTAFQDVTVLAIFDQDTANSLGFDTVAAHIQVYPYLPANSVPNDPSMYNYMKVRLPSGATQILGIPWIDDSTVTVVNLGTITVTLANQPSTAMTDIVNALAANGKTVTSIVFN